MEAISRILIVDDSEVILSVLENALMQCNIPFEIAKARSYAETDALLKEGSFDVAIVDIHLPDAMEGEAIDRIGADSIPVIVLTGTLDDEVKNLVLQKNIFEFVSKNEPNNIRYVASLAKRIIRNHRTNVMIVDDSSTVRTHIARILRKMHLHVFEASDPLEALDLIKSNHIELILTDYEMPHMNGLDFVFKLRELYRKDQLMIMAISAASDQATVTKFLKHGANDYIHKPFSEEELQVRVLEKLSMLDLIAEIQEKAHRDFLTNLYNRRYFYETAGSLLKKAMRKKTAVAFAVMDIDNFKMINDTYGHDVGDYVLRQVGKTLTSSFRGSDLLARLGGEEFCVMLEEITEENLYSLLDSVRQKIEQKEFSVKNKTLLVTISIGICYGLDGSIDRMIKVADEELYRVKTSGKNRVSIRTI